MANLNDTAPWTVGINGNYFRTINAKQYCVSHLRGNEWELMCNGEPVILNGVSTFLKNDAMKFAERHAKANR